MFLFTVASDELNSATPEPKIRNLLSIPLCVDSPSLEHARTPTPRSRGHVHPVAPHRRPLRHAGGGGGHSSPRGRRRGLRGGEVLGQPRVRGVRGPVPPRRVAALVL